MCLPSSILLVPSLTNSPPLITKPLELGKNDIALPVCKVWEWCESCDDAVQSCRTRLDHAFVVQPPFWQLTFRNMKYYYLCIILIQSRARQTAAFEHRSWQNHIWVWAITHSNRLVGDLASFTKWKILTPYLPLGKPEEPFISQGQLNKKALSNSTMEFVIQAYR